MKNGKTTLAGIGAILTAVGGIVASLAQVLYGHGANILDSDSLQVRCHDQQLVADPKHNSHIR